MFRIKQRCIFQSSEVKTKPQVSSAVTCTVARPRFITGYLCFSGNWFVYVF